MLIDKVANDFLVRFDDDQMESLRQLASTGHIVEADIVKMWLYAGISSYDFMAVMVKKGVIQIVDSK